MPKPKTGRRTLPELENIPGRDSSAAERLQALHRAAVARRRERMPSLAMQQVLDRTRGGNGVGVRGAMERPPLRDTDINFTRPEHEGIQFEDYPGQSLVKFKVPKRAFKKFLQVAYASRALTVMPSDATSSAQENILVECRAHNSDIAPAMLKYFEDLGITAEHGGSAQVIRIAGPKKSADEDPRIYEVPFKGSTEMREAMLDALGSMPGNDEVQDVPGIEQSIVINPRPGGPVDSKHLDLVQDPDSIEDPVGRYHRESGIGEDLTTIPDGAKVTMTDFVLESLTTDDLKRLERALDITSMAYSSEVRYTRVSGDLRLASTAESETMHQVADAYRVGGALGIPIHISMPTANRVGERYEYEGRDPAEIKAEILEIVKKYGDTSTIVVDREVAKILTDKYKRESRSGFAEFKEVPGYEDRYSLLVSYTPGLKSVPTKLVGRETLANAARVKQLLNTGLEVVAVEGSEGSGKTAITDESVEWVAKKLNIPAIFTAAGSPRTVHVPMAAFVAVAEQMCQQFRDIVEAKKGAKSDKADKQLEGILKEVDAFMALGSPEGMSKHRLTQTQFAELNTERLETLLIRMGEYLCRKYNGFVLKMDDIHFAHPKSDECLDRIRKELKKFPDARLIYLIRPEDDQTTPSHEAAKEDGTVSLVKQEYLKFFLAPPRADKPDLKLIEQFTVNYLVHRLGLENVEAAKGRALVVLASKSGGNPGVMEELLNQVVEDGDYTIFDGVFQVSNDHLLQRADSSMGVELSDIKFDGTKTARQQNDEMSKVARYRLSRRPIEERVFVAAVSMCENLSEQDGIAVLSEMFTDRDFTSLTRLSSNLSRNGFIERHPSGGYRMKAAHYSDAAMATLDVKTQFRLAGAMLEGLRGKLDPSVQLALVQIRARSAEFPEDREAGFWGELSKFISSAVEDAKRRYDAEDLERIAGGVLNLPVAWGRYRELAEGKEEDNEGAFTDVTEHKHHIDALLAAAFEALTLSAARLRRTEAEKLIISFGEILQKRITDAGLDDPLTTRARSTMSAAFDFQYRQYGVGNTRRMEELTTARQRMESVFNEQNVLARIKEAFRYEGNKMNGSDKTGYEVVHQYAEGLAKWGEQHHSITRTGDPYIDICELINLDNREINEAVRLIMRARFEEVQDRIRFSDETCIVTIRTEDDPAKVKAKFGADTLTMHAELVTEKTSGDKHVLKYKVSSRDPRVIDSIRRNNVVVGLPCKVTAIRKYDAYEHGSMGIEPEYAAELEKIWGAYVAQTARYKEMPAALAAETAREWTELGAEVKGYIGSTTNEYRWALRALRDHTWVEHMKSGNFKGAIRSLNLACRVLFAETILTSDDQVDFNIENVPFAVIQGFTDMIFDRLQDAREALVRDSQEKGETRPDMHDLVGVIDMISVYGFGFQSIEARFKKGNLSDEETSALHEQIETVVELAEYIDSEWLKVVVAMPEACYQVGGGLGHLRSLLESGTQDEGGKQFCIDMLNRLKLTQLYANKDLIEANAVNYRELEIQGGIAGFEASNVKGAHKFAKSGVGERMSGAFSAVAGALGSLLKRKKSPDSE